MSYAPFLIANYKTGLDREVEPWLLPADAFSTFQNAYLKRGVINKRSGYSLWSTFLTPRGNITAIQNQISPSVTQTNHGFLTGDKVFITGVSGMTQINNRMYTITVVSANIYSLNDTDSTAYPVYGGGGVAYHNEGLPIMGLRTYIRSDGTKQLCVFNTKSMGVYDPNGNFGYIGAIGGPYDGGTNRYGTFFTGGDANFFWTENYRS